MKTEFYAKTLHFQEMLVQYAQNIFKTYGRELVLRLEEYNLLQNKNNCIESSTATGFILEEFIVSKLEMYTQCSDDEEFKIQRFVGATASESYDCFAEDDDIKYLINIKIEKSTSYSSNDAIAAIGQLHDNYCEEDEDKQKSFIILKIGYSFRDAYEDSQFKRAKPRHIYIDSINTFCLEEIDFSEGHKQDKRKWSDNITSKNNGRLLVSKKFRQDHRIPEDQVSYLKTKQQLDDLYNNNI